MAEYRKDIDGLRAIAVTIVIAFHMGLPFFDAGFVGVDIFFVLSGFLITGILAKEADERGTIRLARFYTRRLRRLLPASTLTVLATMAASFFLVSALSWETVSRASIAAAFYVSNFYSAQEAGDYFADASESNPLLHFWSLAVEEQFYMAWPLVILGLSKLGSRARLGGLIAITAASLLHSVLLTGAATPWAYYSPLSRAWEFGAGALLALAFPLGMSKRSAFSRELVAWSGFALIGGSLLFIGPLTPFPGVAAIPTVIGTCMVIAATVSATSPLGRVLTSWPFQTIGALSYSWYLWHWPVLVIGKVALGSSTAATRIGLVALSLVFAAASYYLLEKPIRFAPVLVKAHRPNWAMAVALIAVVLGSGLALNRTAETELAKPEFSDLVGARDDVPEHLAFGCNTSDLDYLATTCSGGESEANRTVLVLGDSHAEMWTPMLQELSEEFDFKFVIHILGGCNVVGVQPTISVETCRQVQAQNLPLIDELEPDAVIVSHFARNVDDSTVAEWNAGLEVFLDELTQRGVPVGWIHDTPNFETDPVECAATRSKIECSLPKEEATALAQRLRDREEPILEAFGTLTIDPTNFMCDDTCLVSSNGTFHYRDEHHLTASYAASLAPNFEPFMAELLEQEPSPATNS